MWRILYQITEHIEPEVWRIEYGLPRFHINVAGAHFKEQEFEYKDKLYNLNNMKMGHHSLHIYGAKDEHYEYMT